MRLLASLVSAALLAAAPSAAQVRAPVDGGTTRSLGQPRTWQMTTSAGGGWAFAARPVQGVVEGRLGVYRDVMNPLLSLLGVHVEGYLGIRDNTALDPGVRARLVSHFGRFGIGADYSGLSHETNLILSLYHPGRRGGLFGVGDLIRLDYLPGRDHSVALGIEVPIGRRVPMGSTRPRSDFVRLTDPELDPVPEPEGRSALDEPLSRVREAAQWIRRFIVPFVDHDALGRDAALEAFVREIEEIRSHLSDSSPLHPDAHGLDAEVRLYHAEIERAFSIALAGTGVSPGASTPDGRKTAAYARQLLLDEVLLPYNRLLGQQKKEDTIRGFGARAQGILQWWLHVEAQLPPDRLDEVFWVFSEILEIIEENRRLAHDQWRDSRFVWLPLQYALLPEEHDTQAELDALLERAVGETFADGNLVWYVVNEQFQYQLGRMIREAEDYHVLWTHDIRGFDGYGEPDEMSYRLVLGSYLAAMIERVRAYDETGKLPVYMIFLDQWFYEANQGRLWTNLLEDPLNHRLDLPAGFEAWDESIAAAQEELRRAVEGSGLLQAQRRQFGEEWLRDLVKVHVSITNPADPSFWSTWVVPLINLPDNMMRDHRKIAFYDITEADPYRGQAIYTGAGVGEHYANLSWEDRSILVQGPAVLGLKDAARQLLLNQGIPDEEIPYHLRARPKGPDYDAKVRMAMADGAGRVRALEIHNQSGFSTKEINIAKALLYTLMPPGSVLKAPDSLWNSSFWGALMVGFSLRGGRALVIAPAEANAPSAGFAQLGRSQELLFRLILAQDLLREEIAATGGLLKVGVFAPEFEVTNIGAKAEAVRTALATHEWLRDLYGAPPSFYEALDEVDAALSGVDLVLEGASEFQYDPRPKLHFKANLFASAEAWSSLWARPEWPAVLREYVEQRVVQIRNRATALASFDDFPEALIDVGRPMVQSWRTELERDGLADRSVFFLVMGSHNQNYRSMVVDGEVAFVMSTWPSVAALFDMLTIVGASRWIEDPEDLAELLPPYSEWRRRLGRWLKIAL